MSYDTCLLLLTTAPDSTPMLTMPNIVEQDTSVYATQLHAQARSQYARYRETGRDAYLIGSIERLRNEVRIRRDLVHADLSAWVHSSNVLYVLLVFCYYLCHRSAERYTWLIEAAQVKESPVDDLEAMDMTATTVLLLEQCIRSQRLAVAVAPASFQDLAAYYHDLSQLLLKVWSFRPDHEPSFKQAISAARFARYLAPMRHPCRNECIILYCSLLLIGYQSFGNEAYIKTLAKTATQLLHAEASFFNTDFERRHNAALTSSMFLSLYADKTHRLLCLEVAIDIAEATYSQSDVWDTPRELCCIVLLEALQRKYSLCLDDALLNRAIKIGRELMSLHTTPTLETPTVYGLLAKLLFIRYQQTHDPYVLREVVLLASEAVKLCPDHHDIYVDLLMTKASALEATDATAEHSEEVLSLRRITHELIPLDDDQQAKSGHLLAKTLRLRYLDNRDESLIREAMLYSFEACEIGKYKNEYSQVLASLELALCLLEHWKIEPSPAVLQRAIEYSRLAETKATSEDWATRSHAVLARARAEALFPDENSAEHAIGTLKLACKYDCGSIDFVKALIPFLDEIQSRPLDDNLRYSLCEVYEHITCALNRSTDYALDRRAQLQNIRELSSHLAPDAFASAIAGGDMLRALFLLEFARSSLWFRYLQMKNLCPVDGKRANELRAIMTQISSVPPPQGIAPDACSDDLDSLLLGLNTDLRHDLSLKAHRIIELGDAKFLPPDLCNMSFEHPVAIIVPTRMGCYVCVCGQVPGVCQLIMLDITSEELGHMAEIAPMAFSVIRGRSSADHHRSMKVATPFPKKTDAEKILERLWLGVVNPVLDNVKLKVIFYQTRRTPLTLIYRHTRCSKIRSFDRVCTGALPEISAHYLFTPLVYTMAHLRNAAWTMWCHLIPHHLRL
jgi:hypothetical protein